MILPFIHERGRERERKRERKREREGGREREIHYSDIKGYSNNIQRNNNSLIYNIYNSYDSFFFGRADHF